MRYEEPNAISKDEVTEAFKRTPQEASETLIRGALTIKDRVWVEDMLIRALSDTRAEVQRAALISVGHVARIHKKLDLKKIIPLLQKYAKDKLLHGAAEDALEDVTMFVEPDTHAEA